MPAPTKKSDRRTGKARAKPKALEPLDWRDLASGPALRGLNDVLAGGSPVAMSSNPLPAIESDPVPLAVTPSDPVTPTVGYTPHWVFPEPPWVDGVGILHEAKRVKAVRCPEDSMTMGEERFYQSVWNATADVQVETKESRVFRLGYDRLAKLVRLDEKSVRQLIPKLVFKRIIELVAAENSSERIGRTYRIFSPDAILRRQREVGLQHIVKKGRAVEFVWQSGLAQPPAASMYPSSTTVGVPVTPTESWSAAVAISLRDLNVLAQPSDVRALIVNCRSHTPDASVDEIVYFIQERGRAFNIRPISNPLAYLMVSVPGCFDGDRIRKHREQASGSAAAVAEAVNRAEEDLIRMKSEWVAWLNEPTLPDEDRDFARKMLERIRRR